jgi:N-acetylneuraminate synthase
MPSEMLYSLASYCKEKHIEFMSTPFSLKDAKLVDKFVRVHKIASYEMNHIPLLEFLARTKKPIVVSTGASTEYEIDFTVNYLQKMKVKEIALLQCTACYPAPMRSMNLSVIRYFQKKYGVYVGLSDHSIESFVSPLVAIGLGANIIEKHFTISRKLNGPDHKFALEPNELKNLVRVIRQAEEALGTGKKIIQNEELELRRFAKRAIQAKKNINIGDKLVLGENFDILRPGNRKRGAEPIILDKINGRRVKHRIKSGDGIHIRHIKRS